MKKSLNQRMCEKARDLINSGDRSSGYCKISPVVFIDKLITYEIVGLYIGVGFKSDIKTGRIVLVHKDGSEGAEKGFIRFMDQIGNYEVVKLMLKGLQENNNLKLNPESHSDQMIDIMNADRELSSAASEYALEKLGKFHQPEYSQIMADFIAGANYVKNSK